jgi:hypothetical protein
MVTLRNARHDAIHGADFHTSAVAQAQTGDYVSHMEFSFVEIKKPDN